MADPPLSLLENSLKQQLAPIFANLSEEILNICVRDPSNLSNLQLCIDDLLELRTYTRHVAKVTTDSIDTWRTESVVVESDDDEDLVNALCTAEEDEVQITQQFPATRRLDTDCLVTDVDTSTKKKGSPVKICEAKFTGSTSGEKPSITSVAKTNLLDNVDFDNELPRFSPADKMKSKQPAFKNISPIKSVSSSKGKPSILDTGHTAVAQQLSKAPVHTLSTSQPSKQDVGSSVLDGKSSRVGTATMTNQKPKSATGGILSPAKLKLPSSPLNSLKYQFNPDSFQKSSPPLIRPSTFNPVRIVSSNRPNSVVPADSKPVAITNTSQQATPRKLKFKKSLILPGEQVPASPTAGAADRLQSSSGSYTGKQHYSPPFIGVQLKNQKGSDKKETMGSVCASVPVPSSQNGTSQIPHTFSTSNVQQSKTETVMCTNNKESHNNRSLTSGSNRQQSRTTTNGLVTSSNPQKSISTTKPSYPQTQSTPTMPSYPQTKSTNTLQSPSRSQARTSNNHPLLAPAQSLTQSSSTNNYQASSQRPHNSVSVAHRPLVPNPSGLSSTESKIPAVPSYIGTKSLESAVTRVPQSIPTVTRPLTSQTVNSLSRPQASSTLSIPATARIPSTANMPPTAKVTVPAVTIQTAPPNQLRANVPVVTIPTTQPSHQISAVTPNITIQKTDARPIPASTIKPTHTVTSPGNGQKVPQPCTATPAAPKSRTDSLMENVLALFGDADPAYVRRMVETEILTMRPDHEIVNNLCNLLLENHTFPRAKSSATATSTEVATPEVDNVDYYEDYKKNEVRTNLYYNQTEKLLMHHFMWVSAQCVRRVLQWYNGQYAPTHKVLSQVMKQRREDVKKDKGDISYSLKMPSLHSGATINIIVHYNGKDQPLSVTLLKNFRRTSPPSQVDMDPYLQREINFIRRKQLDEFEEADHQMALMLNEEEYEESGQLIECGCCYGEVPFESMIQCYEGHLFCEDCLQRYAKEAVFGAGKADLKCMTSDCDASYPVAQLSKALPSSILSKYEDRVQEESLNLADLPGLVRCPHCDFAAVLDPGYPVFRCANPACEKETCRHCQEPWSDHIGKTCDQVEKKDEVKLRVQFEEKMTMAKIRTCHKCKAKFTKSEGCNKMTCRCGSKMCYICRKPNIDYNHFCQHVRDPGKGCDKCTACFLWSTGEEDDKRAIEEIKKEAEEARKAQGFGDRKLIGAPDEPPKKKLKV
ncbi:uncharacterized protein [Argopecten irradians]|uniref:uncharacterized protein n=1 Tax=Argopecten irradians TaxID=31199 RepID=UPI00371FD421